MENTHYFMQLGHCNATKNKLQHEVYDYFKSISGLLIDKSDLAEMKDKISKDIQKINQKYPRTKPVNVSFETYSFQGNFLVKSIEAINFKLLKANLVVPNKLPYFSPTLN